ncbi:MAG: TonB-dependent siderophore receptor [Caulobacteraceae bacterium]|nr:TonB-dependent siderophore receptor [Caulobacteraceae bacterium]
MRRTVGVLGAGLSLSPLTAYAGEGGSTAYAGEGGGPVSVSHVIVKGRHKDAVQALSRLPANPKDVSQSITVLAKPLLEQQGANSLADALRNVPGITIGGAEGSQIGNNINLNGFTARTDIFLDGFRDRGQYYRDTFALDEVEVLMGPSSMLFGRGSTGGVINQVSKRPGLAPATEADISGTTNGLVRGTADLNAPLSDVSAFRLAVMGQDGAASTRRRTTVGDYGVAPSYSYGVDTATQLTLAGLIQHNNDQPDYGVSPLNGHPVDSGTDTVYGYANDHTIQDVKAGSIELKHDFGDGLKIRDQVQYDGVDVDARETAPQSLGTVGPGGYTALASSATVTESSASPLSDLYARLQSHDRVIHDTSLFNQLEATAKFTTGPFSHDLLLGSEIGHDEYKNQTYTRTGSCNGVPFTTASYVGCVTVLDPAYTASPTLTEVAGNLAGAKADTFAGYFNDTMSVTPWLKLVGGLRYDSYAATVTNTVTLPLNIHQTIDYTSVRAGAILQPTRRQSYYVSYSTSFDPSLEQLTNTTGVTLGGAPILLPPETNQAYELGGKWEVLHDQLDLTAAAFQITQDNSRSQNSDGTYSAAGDIRVRGARFGFSGHLTSQWQAFGGYTYLGAKIIQAVAVNTAGKVPLNTPAHTATAWTTYDITRQWQVGGGAIYMSSRYANNTDLVSAPAYVRWDATAAWRQPHYEVRLNLFNIFDTHYYDALIASDGGRSVPGLGRTAMLTLTWRD